jgi:AcrR family transcriptional regulator
MANSHGKSKPEDPLNPRKKPSKPGSAGTVEAIVEAAARILEADGLEFYTTNRVADRAGVSVGSLYQYFPSKNAITVLLIQRESGLLARDVEAALLLVDPEAAMAAMINAAVQQQLRRPALAKLLDYEETRLASAAPVAAAASSVRLALAKFLQRAYKIAPRRSQDVASDVMDIVRALTDAASRKPHVDSLVLERAIGGAIRGYLDAISPQPY